MTLHPTSALILAGIIFGLFVAPTPAVAGAGGVQDVQQTSFTGPPISLADIAIPSACYSVKQMVTGTAKIVVSGTCYAADIGTLTKSLNDAFQNPEAMRNVAILFANWAVPNAIVLLVPELEGVEAYIALVKAFQVALDVFDAKLIEELQKELMDPAKAAQLKKVAQLDSQAIAALKAAIFAEHKAFVDAAANYLTSNPGTGGIQFKCLVACQQLVSAANGLNVFDNPTPINNPNNQSTGSPKPHGSHTGWIIGGVLAGAGAAGAAAAVAARNGSRDCSSLGDQCNNLVAQCLNQNIASACRQIDAACTQSCQCFGFSGFNVNTGACQ